MRKKAREYHRILRVKEIANKEIAKYLEATAGSKAKQADVDKLADEVNATWWAKNGKQSC